MPHVGAVLASDVIMLRERGGLDDALDRVAQTLGRQLVRVDDNGSAWRGYLIAVAPGPQEVVLSFAADPEGEVPNPPIRLSRGEISGAVVNEAERSVSLTLQVGLGPAGRVLTITGDRVEGV